MEFLERIDKKILKILQIDGRIANVDLANQVGMSKTACWNRVRRLIDHGYIRYIKAVLNPEKVGLPVLISIGVILERSTPESFADFEQAIKKIPQILECLLLAGEFDYWLKIRVKDILAYNRLYASTLLNLPGVRQLRTFFVLNEIKSSQELPLE
jgi:Lrp/AsnC family transcriptional regulator, leucine-responsive regulatory protein